MSARATSAATVGILRVQFLEETGHPVVVPLVQRPRRLLDRRRLRPARLGDRHRND